MKKTKTSLLRVCSAGVCLFLFLLSACNNEKPGSGNADETTNPASDSIPVVTATYQSLDQFNPASLQKAAFHTYEGGDCNFLLTMYKIDSSKLVIDSANCGDHGTRSTYYLINNQDEIKMVQEKSIEPFYNEKEEFYYALSETIIDFTGTNPVVRSRIDTVTQDSQESKVVYDQNYTSAPWIVLNERDDQFILGKKVDFKKDDWYQVTKNAIKDKLYKMAVLPGEIPRQINGTVGMGIIAEFRDICREAIEEVASQKAYELRQKVNHFNRMTKPLTAVSNTTEENTLAYWTRKYKEIKKTAHW